MQLRGVRRQVLGRGVPVHQRRRRPRARHPEGRREALQVAELRAADDLHAFVGEVAVVSGEGEARTVDGRLADEAPESLASGREFEPELAGVRGVEVTDADG